MLGRHAAWCGRVLLAFAACVVPGAAAAVDLTGKVELFASGQPLRATEAAEAVVYFRSRTPQKVEPAKEPVSMITRRKQFVPRVLAVTAGSSVRFPNEDPILHNAFSTSPNNAFDTGLYGSGAGAVHTFTSPGLVKVYCNVHHSMFGHILVLDTPHFTRPDATGRFELRDVPDAEGDLVVFHDRADPWRSRVVPSAASEVTIRIDLNKRKVPPHMNKFGKPYRRGANASGY
jgi:plastocyanin